MPLLAAVPSIIYGLLGLALFINWMHLPRASPLVGGLVLALMALGAFLTGFMAYYGHIASAVGGGG